MKLASKLASNVSKHFPVLVLIPEDQVYLSQQCLDIRVHDFMVMPISSQLFCQKVTATNHWLSHYQRYNNSFDQQLNLSVRDELTRLYNRRYMNRLLNRLIEQAHNQKQNFSLCIVDIDHFKQFNDTYGHLIGDELLRQLARLMELRIRRHDSIGRWGGEEFIIVFADISQSLSIILAERICRYVAEHDFEISELDQALRITVSIGVSSFQRSDNSEQLISCADKALYIAKDQGRNRVIRHSLAS
ncbi:MAG: diguanylate cyclase [Alphaproteobacteria bacterium]|nr:diguanylate cyclase [Alphaproteobacteria bacterium]